MLYARENAWRSALDGPLAAYRAGAVEGPYAHGNPVHQWFDGLRDWARVFQLLLAHAHAFVMHGHLHAAGDRAVRSRRDVRIFGAPAIVDDDTGPRVRLYDVRGGVIEAAGFA